MDTEAAAGAEKVAGLEDVVVGLETKTSELLAERGKLEEQLEVAKAAASAIESKMAELESSFNELKRNAEWGKQEMEGNLQEKLNELETLQSQKVDFEAKFDFLEAELSAKIARNNELELEMEEMKIEKAAAKKEVEMLQADLAEAGEKHSMVVAEASGLWSEIDRVMKVKEAAAAEYDAERKRMEDELEILKGKDDQIQTEKDALLGMVHDEDAEVGNLREESDKLHCSIADLRALCDDLEGKNSCLEGERDSVLKALEQQKAEAEKLRLAIGELEVCTVKKDLEIGTLKAEVEGKEFETGDLNQKL
jgi:chromosome segregation ATPase